MTLNQRIIQVLSPLGLPVVPDVDTLHRPRCLVFNYDLLPAQPADNRPTWYKALIQVHLYLPLGNDGRELRRQVMEALVDAGMTWPEIVSTPQTMRPNIRYSSARRSLERMICNGRENPQ